jgi:hypothetical protein
MQQSSAIPTVDVQSLDCSIAPKVRGHTSPGQRPGFCQQKGHKAERPRFIRVVSRKWFERPPLKDPGMRASAHLGHT